MFNQPGQNAEEGPTPSRKLVLPPPPGNQSMPPGQGQFGHYPPPPNQGPPNAFPHEGPFTMPPPQPFMAQPMPPRSQGLFARLVALWRRDPAYLVLSLAIVLVVIASLIFVALGANAVFNGNNGPIGSLYQAQHPTTPTPVSTPTSEPSTPTPDASATAQASVTPTPQPSPTATATATPIGQGTLSVQIVSIPSTVKNRDRVHVVVQTSIPGVTVHLQVTYNTAPFYYTSSDHTTDGNGSATLIWNVHVISFTNNNVQAQVVVTATDQNGQQAMSQVAMVTVTG